MARSAETAEEIIARIRGEPDERKAAELVSKEIEDSTNERLQDAIFKKTTYVFYALSFSVFVFILVTSAAETYFICKGVIEPSERVIDGKVFIALITGTVAQLAAMAVIMTRRLFSMPESKTSKEAGKTKATDSGAKRHSD